jgi:hypothetical protein
MNEHASTTVSVSRKVNIGNYESEDVFVSMTVTPDMTVSEMEQLLAANEAAYELVKGEVERRVFGIKNPDQPALPKREYGDAPAQIKPFEDTLEAKVQVLGFTKEQCKEFRTICENAGKDHVTTFLAGWEETCTSFDDYVCYAATGKRPKNAKPRLEVAK